MKKKKLFRVIICTLIFCILLTSTMIFGACDIFNNDDTNDENNDTEQTTSKQQTVELNLNNYEEYFVLQEETLSYEQTDYNLTIGNSVFYKTKVIQTTKFSILLLHENIKFNKVVLTISNATFNDDWTAKSGKLSLSFDGSGSLTITATYNGYSDYLSRHPMKYTVSQIEGTITITN